jgi:hypothetical protein
MAIGLGAVNEIAHARQNWTTRWYEVRQRLINKAWTERPRLHDQEWEQYK